MVKKKFLTKRQQFILRVIEELGNAQNSEILEKVSKEFDSASRITIVRDLNLLKRKNLIKQNGKGRGVFYTANIPTLQQNFDIETYFKTPPDKRLIRSPKLNFAKKDDWSDILSSKEIDQIKKTTAEFNKRLGKYSLAQTKKELERITIEFSWKSSLIEGNTYTLLDTERLIKENKEAPGKTHDEALMILNHKTALEYIWNHASHYKTISPKKIEEIHALVSEDLGISKGFRKRPVGIIGTAYKPFDNTYQIKEAISSLCELLNRLKNPFLKALVAVAAISYIQPFEDGNKRTSRLLGNAVLLAHSYCPISYRSVEEIEYKKAIILFYEQHSLTYFKQLFVEQYEFAAKNYFQ